MEARERPLILVVDDELSARLLMRATLEEGGFDVVEAGTVRQALSLFESTVPDLVMLDVLLPDGDGVDLCARLRALPAGRDVPIAMVTGVNDDMSIQRAYQCGATDHGQPHALPAARAHGDAGTGAVGHARAPVGQGVRNVQRRDCRVRCAQPHRLGQPRL
jgi:CheY-like chemotaxis protein